MSLPDWTISTPEPNDAARLSAFGAARFTATFGFNYPPQDLASFLDTTYAVDKWTGLLADADQHWRMAQDSAGLILGFVQAASMGLPHPHEPDAVELCKLYVADCAKGSGLAAALQQSVLDWARGRAAPALYLGVWSLNPRAQAFYRKQGFEAVGAYQFQVGETLDDEVIMRLGL
ncbi:MAG: GNAT family N-acetyltransferase [Hyphomonadaceae bacterium]|jgi:ribosomal protein S18 acetylase RimI-like enzyme|nr:GNAT family N-acetyltransferase [Hyphomonadaceae bacterium]